MGKPLVVQGVELFKAKISFAGAIGFFDTPLALLFGHGLIDADIGVMAHCPLVIGTDTIVLTFKAGTGEILEWLIVARH
jgi:hypothetical protein